MDILGGQRWILGGLRKRGSVADAIRLKIYESQYEAAHPWISDFYLYPQDENGYSIIPWPTVGKVMYVDSINGDDATAVRYSTGDFVDMENPVGEMAYATWAAAKDAIVDGSDDMILFKRDEIHPVTSSTFSKKGLSREQKIVIGAYGVGDRPKLQPAEGQGFITFWGDPKNVYIKGLEFYHPYSNPYSPEYVEGSTVRVGSMMSMNTFTNLQDGTVVNSSDIGVEDCFSNYSSLFGTGGDYDSSKRTGLIFRKNIILNAYPRDASHQQGAFFNTSQVLVEYNFFHGNGWLNDDTYYVDGTQFNHNVYSQNIYKSIFRYNISSQPSSIHFKFTSNPDGLGVIRNAVYNGVITSVTTNNEIPEKFPQTGEIKIISDDTTETLVNYTSWSDKTIQIESTDFTANPVTGAGGGKIKYTENFPISWDVAIYDNVFLDGEIGLSIGGNYQLYGTNGRWDNYRIFNNIFTELGLSQPTNRTLAFGVELSDHVNSEMADNLFMPSTLEALTNTYTINITDTISNTDVYNNLSYGLGYIESGMPDFVYNNIDITNPTLLVDDSYNLLSYMADKGYATTYEEFVLKCSSQSPETYNTDFEAENIIGVMKQKFAIKTPIVIIDDLPESTFSIVGEDIDININAFANTRLSYEWYVNSASIGNNSSSLILDTTSMSAGDINVKVVISDEFGNTVESNTLLIELIADRNILTMSAGDSIAIDLTANGGVASNNMVNNRGIEYIVKIPSTITSTSFGVFGNNNTQYQDQFNTYRMRFGGTITYIDITDANVNDDLFHRVKFINYGVGETISIFIDGVEYFGNVKDANILDPMISFIGDSTDGDYQLLDIRYFTYDPETGEETDFAFFALDDGLSDGGTANATSGGGTVTFNVDSGSWS